MTDVVLAFDYGEKRIGVAIGNTLTRSARALKTIAHDTVDGRFAQIEALLREWQPARLVVGRPSHPDGAAHQMTARCERFARQLEGRFGVPVTLVDERYTSAIAARELRGAPRRAAEDVDSRAAALILESYFDADARA
jgi:putative Holliday junction resolvase